MKSSTHTLAEREARLAFWMLMPTFALVAAIIIFPVMWTIWLSFKAVSLGGLRDASLFNFGFTLENYGKVFTDPDFKAGLTTTLIYATVGSGISVLLGLIAALLVHGEFPGRSLVRGLFISPYIAPVVAVAFTWSFILDPQLGIFNWFGIDLGIIDQPIPFLSQRWREFHLFGFTIRLPLALASVILFEGWRYFPFAFLFILARLQAIPDQLYLAAKIDGASPFQRFGHVTMPQLYMVLANLFLFRFIWTFNKFDDIFLLTRGQAGTGVLTIKVYDYAFGQFDLGAGSAVAMVLFGVLTVLLMLYFRFVVKGTESVFVGDEVNRERLETTIIRILRMGGLAFFTLMVAFPFYWMVASSLKSLEELLLKPSNLWLDMGKASFQAYIDLVRHHGFGDYLLNSAYVSISTVIFSVVLAILGGYAVTRFSFRGKGFMSSLILLIYMFPAIVLVIPLYVIFSMMGLRDSINALILVYMAQTLPVSLYMLRNYFLTLPPEMEHAGLTDGCSRWGVLWRIIVPIIAPALASVALYTFMIAWNEFLFVFLFLDTPDKFTLSRGVVQLSESVHLSKQLVMAASVISTVPILLLFLFFERYLVKGLTAGSIKG